MRHYRLLFILLLIFSYSSTIFGQLKNRDKTAIRTIVQYNDGSVFIGKIVEEGPLTLRIVIATTDTILLNKAYIKRIKRSDKNISLYDGAKFHYTKGVFYSLNFGSNLSDGDDFTDQVDLMIGYRFNKKFALAIGTGNSSNSTFSFGTWINTQSTPLFAYARYYPFDKRAKPFIGGKVGWGFSNQDIFNGDHSGGPIIQPEIGINFASRRRIRFLISLGQQLHHIKGSILDFDVFGNRIASDYNLWFNRTVLKVGIEWK